MMRAMRHHEENADSLEKLLEDGLDQMGLVMSDSQRRKFIEYVALIERWNRVHNLTAIRSMVQMISHHLLDSLSILPWLSDASVLDVGSGAGLPGIPVAIARPKLAVTLIDSAGKKTAFQQQAAVELALGNVTVVSARVEDVREGSFERIVSRAFSDLATFVDSSAHLLAPGGALLAMKGVMPQSEIDRLPGGFRVAEVVQLEVPRLNAKRHLIRIEKK